MHYPLTYRKGYSTMKSKISSKLLVTAIILPIFLGLLFIPQLMSYASSNNVATTMVPGDLFVKQFSQDDMTHLYSFTSLEDQPVMLALESLYNQRGAHIQLQNIGTGEMIADVHDISTGMCLRLPTGKATYLLEVDANEDALVPYWVMTWPVQEGELDCPTSDMIDQAKLEGVLASGGGVLSLLDPSADPGAFATGDCQQVL